VRVLFGVFAIVNGALHAKHISLDGAAASDYTGVLALAACGARGARAGHPVPPPRRGRGDGGPAVGESTHRSRRRRAAVVLFVAVPVGFAIGQTHKHREPIGAPPSGAYRPVTFEASDGLQMRGWYVPSKNRAAVILEAVVSDGATDRSATTVTCSVSTPSRGSPPWRSLPCGCSPAPRPATRSRARRGHFSDATPPDCGRTRHSRGAGGDLLYAAAAREPVELWDLPDVSHTAAIRERPEEYERRVIGFFRNALLAGASY
jgi:hypothetical protein